MVSVVYFFWIELESESELTFEATVNFIVNCLIVKMLSDFLNKRINWILMVRNKLVLFIGWLNLLYVL